MTRRVLLDVTQFVRRPVASGVQRVLRHVASDWRGDLVEPRFGHLEDSRYTTFEAARFAKLVAEVFASGGTISPERAKDRLSQGASEVGIGEVSRSFDAYMLPEPAVSGDVLEGLQTVQSEEEIPTMAIGYDALPATSPWNYAFDLRPYDRYYQVVSKVPNLVFISDTVREEFELRLRRRPYRRSAVIALGADGLSELAPESPPERERVVLAVGSVERRKKQATLLAAMDELWRSGSDLRLVVLGREGSETPEFLRTLRRRAAEDARVVWDEEATDKVVAHWLSRASVLVFVGSDEGYGLPAVESLSLGCPLIASSDLPALRGLPTGGQLRIPGVGVDELRRAIEYATDPANCARLSREASEVPLPTWNGFACELEAFTARVVDES